MERNVIAVAKFDVKIWDNFQCKHYKDPLSPAIVWVELGELVHHTSIRAIARPPH